MSSIFSFIRPPEPEAEESAPAEGPTPLEPTVTSAPGEAGLVAAPAPAAALSAPIPPVSVTALAIAVLTSVDQVPTAIASALQIFLPPAQDGLPAPGVIIVNISDRNLGMGNFRGLETRGIFPAVELKGGHAEALVRFQLFSATPEEVNSLTLTLQGLLMAARADLWDAGFLEMSGVAGTLATQQVSDGPWTRTADYQLLFEYHLAPTAGAESLIARIPIAADQEVFNSLARETTVVSDEMVRWDQLSAAVLTVRGTTRIASLSTLVYFEAALAGGAVTLLRTHDGASGAPTSYPTLGDFLNAVASTTTPERHGSFSFASLSDFLLACSAAGDPFPLGDWDSNSIPDVYQSLELALDPPLSLPGATDRLEISPGVSPLDQVGVVYLRARRG